MCAASALACFGGAGRGFHRPSPARQKKERQGGKRVKATVWNVQPRLGGNLPSELPGFPSRTASIRCRLLEVQAGKTHSTQRRKDMKKARIWISAAFAALLLLLAVPAWAESSGNWVGQSVVDRGRPAPAVSSGSQLHSNPEIIEDCTEPCPLSLEFVRAFGDDEGPGMIEYGVRGFTDGNGLWYMVDGPSTAVKVYSDAGRFLNQIGRSGEGPGEFKLISSLLPLDSSIAVLDITGRLQFFDPEGRTLRQTRLPFPPTGRSAVWAQDLGWVIAANVPTPERAGFPLHVVDLEDGSVDRSFGSVSGESRLSEVGRGHRVLAQGPAGAVWAAPLYEYRIGLWTPDGLQRSLVRDARWFPPASQSTLAHGWSERPNTVLTGLAATSSELWVKFRVADERWSDAAGIRDLFWDTVIEVIDLDELRVIGRARLDEDYGNFVGPGMIGRTAVTADASVQYQVFRIVPGRGHEPGDNNPG